MSSQLFQGKCRSIHDPIESLSQDLLGRQALAEAILERLCTSEANILGIYGGWGTGKTSLLNLLYELNMERRSRDGNENLRIEVIDAWKYEITGSLFVPIIMKLKKFAAKEQLSAVATKQYLKRIGKIAVLGIADIGLHKLGLSVEYVRKVMNDAKDMSSDDISYLDWENLVDDVDGTSDAFRELVGVALKGLAEEGNRPERIVFCIDNLDRCSPEAAVKLLESVKIFFSATDCAWVFAMDSDVIASYIDKKYEGTAVNGYSFLDKIIPEQYHLSLTAEENGRRIFDLIYEVTGKYLTLHDQTRLPQIPRVLVPRRLIKSAKKFEEYYAHAGGHESNDTVFLLCLLYHAWPDFYERLSSPALEHVGGVLGNYFGEPGVSNWSGCKLIKLSIHYIENQDLANFLEIAFPACRKNLDGLRDIHRALSGLREIGLP